MDGYAPTQYKVAHEMELQHEEGRRRNSKKNKAYYIDSMELHNPLMLAWDSALTYETSH